MSQSTRGQRYGFRVVLVGALMWASLLVTAIVLTATRH